MSSTRPLSGSSVLPASAVDVQLRPIARQRLARVQAAQGKHDLALTTLAALPSATDVGEYQAAYTETRGDILLSKGDRAGALREYQAARKLQPEEQTGSSVAVLLDLKINDLRPATMKSFIVRRVMALGMLSALAALAACEKNKNIDPPAELTDFKATAKVEKVWSSSIGGGEPELRLGLGLRPRRRHGIRRWSQR